MRYVLRAAPFSMLALIACDSPLEPYRPQGQYEVLPVGRVIEDFISGGAARNYSFDAEIGAQYVVYLKSLSGPVLLGVADPATGYTIATVGSGPNTISLEQNPSNDFPTPLGSLYPIDVAVLSGDTARFQFKITKVNTAPEAARELFEFGDTIHESIDHLADVDMFYVHAEAGQTVTAMVQPLGDNPGGLTLYVDTRDHPQVPRIAPARADLLLTTGPMRLETRDYRFTIRGTWIESTPRHVGPYKLWSYVIHPEPEHLQKLIPLGVEIRGERIDYPDDADNFEFTDTVGAEFAAFLEGPRPFMLLVMSSKDTTTSLGGAYDADADTALLHHSFGLFRIADAGAHRIRVVASNVNALVADTGAYRFMLYRIDRRPENVAALVQVGDTVSGEASAPIGDIDQFTLNATPGTQLAARFRLTADAIPRSGRSVSLAIVDPGTGESLNEIVASLAGPFQQGGSFFVPASGTVQVRVGYRQGLSAGSAPYEFFVAPPTP